MIEGLHQLEAAPADPGMVLAAHFQRLVGAHALARLFDAALAGKDLARQDQGLGLAAAFYQAALDQGLIDTLLAFGCHGRRADQKSARRRKRQIIKAMTL